MNHGVFASESLKLHLESLKLNHRVTAMLLPLKVYCTLTQTMAEDSALVDLTVDSVEPEQQKMRNFH